MATAKTLPQDNLGQQLLMQILGGGNRENITTSAGNINPAMQVFGQASAPIDPQMLQALMTSIQQNAATNIPATTAALANATGTRSSSNSPLALALNEQNNKANNDALVAIMNANLQKMGQANQAASTIAGATRGTDQTKTNGMKNPLNLLMGGMLLNKADKTDLFGKVGKKAKDLFGFGDDNAAGGFSLNGPSIDFGSGPVDYSLGAGGGVSDMGFSATPLAGAFDASSLGNYDFGGYDLGGGLASDFASIDPSSWDFAANYDLGAGADLGGLGLDTSGFDAASWFSFADGGAVSPAGKKSVSSAAGKGVVGSRRNAIDAAEADAVAGYDPNAALRAVIAASMANPVQAMGARIMNPGGMFPAGEPNPVDFLMRYMMPGQPDNIYSYADGGSLTGPGPGAPMVTRNRANMGAAPKKAKTSVTGGPGINSSMLGDMSSRIFSGAQQRMDPAQFAAFRQEMQAKQDEAKKDALNKGAAITATNVGISQIPVYGQMYALANFFSKAIGGPDFGERLYTWFDEPVAAVDKVIGPFADAGDELTSSIIEDAKDPLGSALDPSRPLDVVRNVFSKFGFADGGSIGEISGPGTGTSDSITAHSKVPGVRPIRVSSDEFIMPADTVRTVGKDFLNNLIAMTHAPVRR